MKFYVRVSTRREAVAPAKVVIIIRVIRFKVGAGGFGLIANSAEVSEVGPMISNVLAMSRFSDLSVGPFRLNFDILTLTTRGLIRVRRGGAVGGTALTATKHTHMRALC